MDAKPEPTGYRIGYVRVSTEDQSMSLQLSAMERAGVRDVIEDKASGATFKRPGWERLWKALRPGDTLVIWKLDRLGRDVKGVLNTLEQLEARGVQLEVLTEAIDTKTPMGRMVLTVLLSFAQMERELTAERTKAGMAVRKAQGHVFGPKHSISSYPERLQAVREFIAQGGDLYAVAPDHILSILNGEDGVGDEKLRARLKRLRKIKNAETFRRWRRDGFPGLKPDDPKEAARGAD